MIDERSVALRLAFSLIFCNWLVRLASGFSGPNWRSFEAVRS